METEERRNAWAFLQGDKGAWTWRMVRPDGSAATSVPSFLSLNDCVRDAVEHGYVLPPRDQERRSNPKRPPASMLLQEVTCPHCKWSWELDRAHFVAVGDVIRCVRGCGDFRASASTVTCCIEDGEGLAELPLS
ncbi:MAG TPA: hypothetical protein VED01_24945 [Burkholderiales bacterium]|nr:hypothetical protein [Burkholderiales bacterium]